MYRVARFALLSLVVGLTAACAVQHPGYPSSEQSSEPIPTIPGPSPTPQPGTPRTAPQTPPSMPIPAPGPKTSAHFAPPPGGNSHWDARLGVHVLDNVPNTFYRQRTYYRWNNGWTWSTSPSGPWQETDASGVPPGLSKQFGN
jgi:hypothetical protein